MLATDQRVAKGRGARRKLTSVALGKCLLYPCYSISFPSLSTRAVELMMLLPEESLFSMPRRETTAFCGGAARDADARGRLECPASQLILRPASPAIFDHAHCGVPSRNTIVALRTEDGGPYGQPRSAICIVDCGPIWRMVPNGLLLQDRLRGPLQSRCPTGFTLCWFRAERRAFGVEIWVGSSSPWPPHKAVVLFAAPTYMAVRLYFASRQLCVVTGHGPHRGHSVAARAAWWEEFSGC